MIITSKTTIIYIDELAEIQLGDLHINIEPNISGTDHFGVYVATKTKLGYISKMKPKGYKFYKVTSITGIIAVIK